MKAHLPACLLNLVLLSIPAVHAYLDARAFPALNESQLESLAAPDPLANLDPARPDGHLAHILIPRPPDTTNNTLVKNYLVSTLRALSWDVEEDAFTDSTPYGEKKFTNVIATKDKDAPRRLVLSAHFDSKFFDKAPANQFVGATDSAAPCALLLDLAGVLNPHLDRRKALAAAGDEQMKEAEEVTLQLVFFDGEEAYRDWTATDSLYGSRHLAAKWEHTYLPLNPRRLSPAATQLSTIEHLVLLDLLGASNPLITSYFPSTAWLFDSLVRAQANLGESGLLNVYELVSDESKGKWEDWDSFFVPRTGFGGNVWHVEDDHVPFLKRGVSILHVIASPFPRVWHSLADDASALDMPTLKRWNLIFRVFTAEYLSLPVPRHIKIPSASGVGRHNELIKL